jgi:hypothetical protein
MYNAFFPVIIHYLRKNFSICRHIFHLVEGEGKDKHSSKLPQLPRSIGRGGSAEFQSVSNKYKAINSEGFWGVMLYPPV